MPGEETAAATAEETTETTSDLTADEQAAVEKAENPDAVRNAIQRQKDAVRSAKAEADALRAKVEQYESANKSEKEKLEERAAKAEADASSAGIKALRYEVAAEKGVPLSQAHRLQGSTKAELEADADAFVKDLKGSNGGTTFDGGASGREAPGGGGDMNSLIRRAAGR